jgi:hypothetical protein
LALEDSQAKEKVKVYTDGSSRNGKVGAAAILMRAGEPTQTLHYHLRPSTHHTVHKVELIRILLGLHLIKIVADDSSLRQAIDVETTRNVKRARQDLQPSLTRRQVTRLQLKTIVERSTAVMPLFKARRRVVTLGSCDESQEDKLDCYCGIQRVYILLRYNY